MIKNVIIFCLLSLIIFGQDQMKVARRMKVVVADFDSAAPQGSILSGVTVSDEFEKYAFQSQIMLENLILKERIGLRSRLTGLKPSDISSIIKRGRSLDMEGMLVGKITKGAAGKYNIQVQLIDIQKKNIPSSRRIINFAEVKDVTETSEDLIKAMQMLTTILEKGVFPRVDIVTPNFDVVSIISINKENFPELKLRVSVVNRNGDPVSIPTDLFEVRENGNMVLYDIQKLNTDEEVKGDLTLLFAVDRSPSMLEEVTGVKSGKPFERAKNATIEFLNKLRPSDRVKIVAFDYYAKPIGPYTTDKASYVSKLNELKVGRGTGLYNILKFSVQDIKDQKGEKAVILLTDGKNDVRKASAEVKAVTLEDGLGIASRYTIPVYTIGFGGADEAVLKRIAKETHSQFFKAASSEKLRELYLKLHKIIENQYIITYKSFADKFGKINVSLNIKDDERTFSLSAEEQTIAADYRKQREDLAQAGGRTLKEQEITSLQKRLSDEKVKLEKEKNILENQKKALAVKETELSNLKTTLDARDAEVAKKEKDLSAERQKLAERRKTIQEIQDNILRANMEIMAYLKEKMDYIKSQEARLKELENGK